MDTELSRSTHPFEVACEPLRPTGGVDSEGEPTANREMVNGMAPDLHGHKRWSETPHSVIAWLEEQVKSHLTLIDRKVDRLALRMETCADGITRMESNHQSESRPPKVRFRVSDTCPNFSSFESDISPLRFSGSSPDVPPPSNNPPVLPTGHPAEPTHEGIKIGDKVVIQEADVEKVATVTDFTSHGLVEVKLAEADGRVMTYPRSELQLVAETSDCDSETPSCGSFQVLEQAEKVKKMNGMPKHVGHVIPMKLSEENGSSSLTLSRMETTFTIVTKPPGEDSSDELPGWQAEMKRQATGRLKNAAGRKGARTAVARASESIAFRLDDLNNRLPSLFHKDRNHFVEDAYNFFDDPESSLWAQRYSQSFDCLIMLSSLLTVLQTVDPPMIRGDIEPFIFLTFDFIFCFEAVARFTLTPNLKGYFCCWFNWIDIVAATPIIWRVMQPGFRTPLFIEVGDSIGRNMLVCVAPILRLMKMIRHFEKIHILYSAFNQSVEALPVLLYIQMMITLSFASMIYFVEPRDNIESYPQAIWLSIVTMTTVGYGDVTPQDPKGAIVVSVLVIGSMLFMAMPLGIIGSAFNQVWSNRDAVLLMSRTRDRLVKWGYTAHDIPLLFQMVDQDGDGELELEEFKELIRQMKIGLDDQRIISLFHYFDLDNSGSIDAKEFVKYIFPTAYVEMFGLVGVGKSRLSDYVGEMRNTTVQGSEISDYTGEISEPCSRLMTSFRLQPGDEADE